VIREVQLWSIIKAMPDWSHVSWETPLYSIKQLPIILVPFSFFFVSDITAIFIPLVFISSTSSDSLFPVDLTFHVTICSVSCIPNYFSFFVPGRLSFDPPTSLSLLVWLLSYGLSCLGGPTRNI